MQVGNIYKDHLSRIVVEKKIGFNYFTVKKWLNGKSSILSMGGNEFNGKELICNISER